MTNRPILPALFLAAISACARHRAAPAQPAPSAERPPPWCGGACKPLFDGKTLEGWDMQYPGSFVVKDGAIASTGKGSHLWTAEDFTDYRLFFEVRHFKAPAKDHRPTVTLFNSRPVAGQKFVRGLGGIQFQPPHGGSWDYRKPGQDGDPKKNPDFYQHPAERPSFDDTRWHRCEVLVRGSVGEFRAACCQSEGDPGCKAVEVLRFKDPALAGSKGPFAIQIHNDGLVDEYRSLWVDPHPNGDDLLSTK